MSKEVIRIAVVGLRHGTQHLDHYKGRDDVKIVGICDSSPDILSGCSVKYKVPEEAHFNDYLEMLKESRPDAVFVMTPVPFHSQMTVQALESGCHVFVAKSLCRSMEEGLDMIRARDKSGKHVEVGFQMHYAPIYRYLQEHLADPGFGELRGAWIQYFYPSYWRQKGNWQNSIDTMGGALLDCAIHSMDVLLYVLGRRWLRVFASGRQFLDGPEGRDTMDAATVLVDLEGGARLTLDFADSRAYCYVRTGVVGSIGKFEMEHWEPNGSGHVRFHGDPRSENPVNVWIPPKDSSVGHIGINEQSAHFINVCKGNEQPRSNLESAMESLSLQLAIVRSLRLEKWIDREHN